MLSIIIVNYRTWQFIERNLDNLLGSLPQDRETDMLPFEVIVADNSPGDEGMQEFVRKFPWVRIVRTEGNFGYGYAVNRGAELARGDWLLFMNPDVVCYWQNLQALLDAVLGREPPRRRELARPLRDRRFRPVRDRKGPGDRGGDGAGVARCHGAADEPEPVPGIGGPATFRPATLMKTN